MSDIPEWIESVRAAWTNRGVQRPAFSVPPGPGQESVWDYPRPPAIITDTREIIVRWQGHEVVRTVRALRVLETAHPPTFYLPLEDVDRALLQIAHGSSCCEWKGAARYWTLVDGSHRLERIGWSYPAPLPGAEALAGRIAFYATGLECTVGDAPVTPQPGGFYGGWITPELCGPFKGEPGSQHW